MLANIILLVLLLIFATILIVWWRSGNSGDVATNGLLKHRRKRAVNYAKDTPLPDASRAHAHEKKLKIKDVPIIDPHFLEFILITSISEKHKYYTHENEQNMRKPHPLLSKLIGSISDAKTLYETVKTDPELVAKIINVSNSPLFGLSKPITNVNHAIVYLGIVQVKNIATHFALQESLDFADIRQQQAYQQIWATSFLASSIVLTVATALQFENAAELSTRCQLGYLGDIATLFSDPETASLYIDNMSYFERIEYIQQLSGANSAIFGGILAKKWNLPQEISRALHNSSLPFTNQIAKVDLSELEIQHLLVCYCCSRVAEAIILNNDSDILNAKTFSFDETAKEEFYYMPQLLETYHLTKLLNVFNDANTKSKIVEAVQLTKQKLR